MTEETHSEVVEPEVGEAFAKAINVFGELGASVQEVSIPLVEHTTVVSRILVAVEPALNHRRWILERPHDYGHANRIGLLTGSVIPSHAYLKAQKLRTMLRREVLDALRECDVLVTPTCGRTAQGIAEDPVIASREMAAYRLYLLTRLFNLANAPAVSVPCGFDSSGLPVGLQIGGRPGGDEVVLKVGHAYEQATPWHTTRPPNS